MLHQLAYLTITGMWDLMYNLDYNGLFCYTKDFFNGFNEHNYSWRGANTQGYNSLNYVNYLNYGRLEKTKIIYFYYDNQDNFRYFEHMGKIINMKGILFTNHDIHFKASGSQVAHISTWEVLVRERIRCAGEIIPLDSIDLDILRVD